MLLVTWLQNLMRDVFQGSRTGRSRRRRVESRSVKTPRTVSGCIELLEDRTLLSTIELTLKNFDEVFGNASTDGLFDLDGDGELETRSEVAQNVARAAVQRWEDIIIDFNTVANGNIFELAIVMDLSQPGTGGVTPSGELGFDPFTGAPTSATVYLNSGIDIDPDPAGDGYGFFLDPTPNDWEEFPNRINAFAGSADYSHSAFQAHDFNGNGTPDNVDLGGLTDFYRLVAHEVGHAMGMSSNIFVDYPAGFATNTGMSDTSTTPNVGTLWVWESPNVPGALMTSRTGNSASQKPVHVASPGQQFTNPVSGEIYSGIRDLMNPATGRGIRTLISNLDVAILNDVYGYTVTSPDRWGTYYAFLDADNRTVEVRGGQANDFVTIQTTNVQGRAALQIDYLIGDAPTPYPGTLNSFSSLFFPDEFDTVNIDLGDSIDNISGADVIDVNSLPSEITVNIAPSAGDDFVRVYGMDAGSELEFNGGSGNDVLVVSERPNSPRPNEVVQGTIRFSGGQDSDQIEIQKARNLTIESGEFTFDEGGRIEFLDSTIESGKVELDFGNQTLNVESNRLDELIIDAELLGAKTIHFAPETQNLDGIKGTIRVQTDQIGSPSDGDEDRVEFHDRNADRPRIEVTSTLSGADLKLQVFESSSSFLASYFLGEATYRIETSNVGSETIFNATINSDRPFEVVGGSGDDRVWVQSTVHGGSGELGLIRCNIDFDGGGGTGTDRFILDNRNSTFNTFFMVADKKIETTNTQELRDFLFNDVEFITLRTGAGSESITIDELPSPTTLLIRAGEGNDAFIVGAGDIDSNIRGTVNIFGEGGNNSVLIDDAADNAGEDRYEISADAFDKTGFFGSLTHTDIAILKLYAATEFTNEILITGGPRDIDIYANGEDTVKIGQGTLDGIRGEIEVFGGSTSEISIEINDLDDEDNHDYVLDGFSVRRFVGPLTVTYNLVGTASLTLNASRGSNDIDIYGSIGLDFFINGGAGNDNIRFSNDDDVLDNSYFSPIHIDGQEGTDTVTFYDNGHANDVDYIVDRKTIQRNGTQTFDIGTVEQVTLYASKGENRIDITGTSPGVTYNLYSGLGDDQFYVGDGFLRGYLGLINLYGGNRDDSDDQLFIDDSSFIPLTPVDYEFATELPIFGGRFGTFRYGDLSNKLDPVEPIIHFRELTTVELQTRNTSQDIFVRGTLENTRYRLFGNGGQDTFQVHADELRSQVFVFGGDPTSAPGDELILKGDGESVGHYVATGTNSGTIDVDGHVITFAGLEPIEVEGFDSFTMTTPLGRDILEVKPSDERAGWTWVGGTSGVQGMRFESVLFTNVREFIVDAASNDLVPDPAEPNFPLIVPVDTITIEADALNAVGLEKLTVDVGMGPNVIQDYTLESSQPLTAMLELVSLPNMGTVHLLYGTANNFSVEQNTGFLTTINATDSQGRRRHRVVSSGLTTTQPVDPQPNAEFRTDGMDWNLNGINGRQSVNGDGLTNIELLVEETGVFRMLLNGQSLNVRKYLLPTELEVTPDPAAIVIDPGMIRVFETAGSGTAVFRGFDRDHSLIIHGIGSNSGSVPTSFSLDAQDPANTILINQSAVGSSDAWNLQFEPTGGEYVGLKLAGDAGVTNTVTAQTPDGQGWDLIELLVDLTEIELLVVPDTNESRQISVEGRTGIGAETSISPTDRLSGGLTFLSDLTLNEITTSGGGGADVFSATGDLSRTLTTNLIGYESLSVDAGTGSVDRSWTGDSGEVESGGLTILHDASLATSVTTASFVTDRLSGQFDRDISLTTILTGSEHNLAIEDAEFLGNFTSMTIGKETADNQVYIAEHKSIYHGEKTVRISGGNDDKVLVSRVDVDARNGSETQINSLGGQDTIILLNSANQGAGDEFLLSGNGGGKLVAISSGPESPLEQLNQLILQAPELGPVRDGIGDPNIKSLLEVAGGSIPNEAHAQFVTLYAESIVEIVTRNESVERGELVGTGIDPNTEFRAFAVTNTADSGDGSLRSALEQANAWTGTGLAVVYFAIDSDDANFVDVDSHRVDGDVEPDAFQISPLSALPALLRGNIVVNGQSQQVMTGDTNPFGPEVVLNGANASHATEIDGLISLYRFDGNTNDTVGGNQPFQTAGISYVDGQIGSGISLEPGGYVDIPHTPELAQQVFSVSAWVRPDGPGPNNDEFGSNIIQKSISGVESSFKLAWVASSQRFLLSSGDIRYGANRTYSADTFAPGDFYHVAATFDGTVFRLYVNGEFQGQHTRNSPIDYEPSIPWVIGSTAEMFRDRNFPRTWNGVIDEVGIYNRALTHEEITRVVADVVLNGANASHATEIDGLISLYRFDGNTNDTVGGNQPIETDGVAFVDARFGDGMTLEPGGYVDIPHSDELARQTFTLSAWVRPDGPGPNDDEFGSVIIQKGIANLNQSVSLWWSAQSQRFVVGSGNVFNELNRTFSVDTFAPGEFYHVAATFDGTVFRLYVNGEHQGEHTRNPAIDYNPNIPWTIGSTAEIFRDRPGQPNFPRTWNGVIDEVGIYDRALTHEEITRLSADTNGLDIKSSANYVHGLNIQDFSGSGIEIGSDINTLTANFIGTNATGDATAGNGEHGVHLVNADRNVIGDGRREGGNLISGNQLGGIVIEGGLKNRIQGNTIGLTSDGQSLGNSSGIVLTNTSDALVGGEEKFDGNIISASRFGHGVLIQGRSATGNQVIGNYIGLDQTGTQARGNAQMGVFIADSSGHTIRSNVVSDNLNGIYLVGQTTADNVIENNRVGTNAAGTEAIGNRLHGILLLQAQNTLVSENLVSGQEIGFGIVTAQSSRENLISNNRIGTTADGLSPLGNQVGVGLTGHSDRLIGNLISGNLRHGVSIDADFAGDGRGTGHVVQGNWIGVAADGVSPLGNGTVGIQIIELAANNVIGTDGDGINDNLEGNIIAYNRGVGVAVSDGSVSNPIRGNSIYSNGDLGIALGPALGVSPNDPLDTDGGGNLQQNFPVIEQALFNRELSVRGRLSAAPLTTYILDFYANFEADSWGHGEGRIWLGSLKVRTGEIDKKTGEAIAAFRFVHSFEEFAAVQFITTTATDPFGNTSEFSNVAPIEIPGPKPQPGGNLTAATAETQENLISPSLSGTDALEVESSTSNQERAISPSGAAASTVSPEPKTEDELLSWSVEPVESSPNSEWDALFADFDLQLGDELLTIL